MQTVMDCASGYKDSDGNILLAGDGAGNANFAGDISRAQFAKVQVVLAKLAGGTPAAPPAEANSTFDDVKPADSTSEFKNALYVDIEAAANLDLMDGVGDGKFSPGLPISYAQVVKAVDNLLAKFVAAADLAADSDGTSTSALDCKAFDAALDNLAELGIVKDGTSNLPADCTKAATRGQVYDLFAATASYLVEKGLVTVPASFKPATPPTNQTFVITPADAATVTDDDVAPGETGDQRQYTVTNPVASKEHDIALFHADRISVVDGVVTFLDAAGKAITTGAAAPGTVTSRIVAINNVPADNDQQDEFTPDADGTAFKVNVDGDGFESIIPVVFFDADNDGLLDLNPDGTPKSDEPFGIGGTLHVRPNEAPVGFTGSGTVDAAFPDENLFVATFAGPTQYVLMYDASGDVFSINGAQATLAKFKEKTTKGDGIAVTDYQQEESLKSDFALTNVLPATPVISGIAAGERSIELSLTGIATGATVNVYFKSDSGTSGATGTPAYDTTFTKITSSADEDGISGGWQVSITGLNPSSDYEIYVSQSKDGDESLKANTEASTNADVNPTVVSAIANDINDGIGSTNELLVTFSEAVTVSSAAGFTVSPDGQPSFVLTGASAVKANTTGTKWVITLDKSMNDAKSPEITYDVAVAAEAFSDAGGKKNVAASLDNEFDY